MEEVHLEDIAEAASVSVGECCRCFQNMVRYNTESVSNGILIREE